MGHKMRFNLHYSVYCLIPPNRHREPTSVRTHVKDAVTHFVPSQGAAVS